MYLVERIGQRDEASLASLFDDTHRVVYGLALRVVGDPQDAEQVTLDVYNHVWRTARSFEAGRGTVMAWLLTLTRGRALERVRVLGTKAERTSQIRAGAESEGGAATESRSAWWHQRAAVTAALGKLNPDQREALELTYFCGLSHVELAELLNQPIATVKDCVRSAMIKMRDYLKHGGELGQEAGS